MVTLTHQKRKKHCPLCHYQLNQFSYRFGVIWESDATVRENVQKRIGHSGIRFFVEITKVLCLFLTHDYVYSDIQTWSTRQSHDLTVPSPPRYCFDSAKIFLARAKVTKIVKKFQKCVKQNSTEFQKLLLSQRSITFY
jgi:hypothetical protein